MPTPAPLPWTLVRDALPPVSLRTMLLAVANADGVQYSTGYYDDDDGTAFFVVDGDDDDGRDAAAVFAWLPLSPPRLTGPLFTGLKG